jgi:hypothetical protein
LLDAAGLFSLSILGTLNLERNVMEHEYKVPGQARVQEMVDVGRLLLLATREMGSHVPYECLAGCRSDESLGVIQLDPGSGMLSFFRATGPTQVFSHEGRDVTLLEPIRATNGGLLEGIEIGPEPVWAVHLGHRNRGEWRPLLTPLVRLADVSSGFRSPITDDGRMEVTVTTTLPRDQQKVVQEAMLGKGRPILDYSRFMFGFDSPSS